MHTRSIHTTLVFIFFTWSFNSQLYLVNARTRFLVLNDGQEEVPVNTSVIIRCPSLNSSSIQLAVWEKDTVPIGELRNGVMEFKHHYQSPPDRSSNKNLNLYISRVQVTDEGVFQCRQTYKSGKQYFSKTLRLFVPVPSQTPMLYEVTPDDPQLVTMKQPVYLNYKNQLILKCEANKGHPGAMIQWRLSGAFLRPRKDDGAFAVKGITGRIESSQSIVGKSKPPVYRNAVSILTAKFGLKNNGSMITCFSKTKGIMTVKNATTYVLLFTSQNGGTNACVSSETILILILNLFIGFWQF